MKLPRRKFLQLAASAAALPVLSRFAWAQVYPTRPVRTSSVLAPVADFGKLISEETEKWAKVVKFAGIKAE